MDASTNSNTSIIPSLHHRPHPIPGHRDVHTTPFHHDIGCFSDWRNDCIRAVLDIYHDYQTYSSMPENAMQLDSLGEEERARMCVEWRDYEGIAFVLQHNYHLFGNFAIMFGGRDLAGNVKIFFYCERTAHFHEMRILAYIWILNTPSSLPSSLLNTPVTRSLPAPITPPSRKRRATRSTDRQKTSQAPATLSDKGPLRITTHTRLELPGTMLSGSDIVGEETGIGEGYAGIAGGVRRRERGEECRIRGEVVLGDWYRADGVVGDLG